MALGRRRFLKFMIAAGGTSIGAAALWSATANSRTARWVRRMFADSRRTISPAPVIPDPAKWPSNGITICWLGHSTVLIDFYGVRILTDPALRDRVGVSLVLGTAGPKRLIAPALRQ